MVFRTSSRLPFSYAELDAKAAPVFRALSEAVRSVGLRPFEGRRSGDRQAALLRSGASRTRHSLHLAGRAVDYAVFGEHGWRWPPSSDPCWVVLREEAHKLGLWCELPWDQGHVEWRRKPRT